MNRFILLALPAALLFAGCEAPDAVDARKLFEDHTTFVFDELLEYHLKLEVAGENIFASGDRFAQLVFRLRNTDSKPLDLPDWKGRETDNIILHIRQYHPDESRQEAAAAEWFTLEPDGARKTQYVPFTIDPLNFVTIRYPLALAAEAPPDKGAYFMAYAELNLDTVEVYSDMFIIQVIPADKMQPHENEDENDFQW